MKRVFLVFCNVCVTLWGGWREERSKMYVGLHVQCPLSVFMYSAHCLSSCAVPTVCLHVQCPLSVFIYSAHCRSSCTVPLSVFIYSALYSCPVLIKLEFYRQVFEKYSSTKLYENPTNWNRVSPGGQTERQDKANSPFSQFCKCAQKWCNINGYSRCEMAGTSNCPFASIYCKA